MRSLLGRFHRPFARGTEEQLLMLNNLGDGSTLSLDFTTGVLDPRLTFTRLSGGTYVANDGYIYGMDFATSSSLAIGTGSKSVTLTATAGVDRRYLVGQTVYISNGANNMSGPVTAYNASTQVLTINATGTSGSGSFTSWTVGNASARFDYDPTSIGTPRGLLIEGSAVNLVTQSNGSTGVWTTGGNRTPTNDTTDLVSPDGTNNATRLVCGTAGNYASFARSIFGLTGGATYTISYWIRGPVGHSPRLYAQNGTIGDVTATATTGTYNNTGWTRLTQTYTLPAATTQCLVYFLSTSIVNTGDTFYVYGFQMETGSGASSHIPTGASTGSRAADFCYMDGTNFSSWFNATEGAFLAHARRMRTTDVGRIASANDNTANESIDIGASTTGQFIVTDGGSALATITPGTVTANTAFKIAGAFKLNDVQAALGGTLGTPDTGVTMPTVNQLMIGRQAGGSPVYLNGTVSLLKFWPVRLPDAQLQSLTT